MENFSLAGRVKARFPNLIVDGAEVRGTPAVIVKKEGILAVASVLKNDPELDFGMLMDLFAVDYLFWEEKEFRFEVIYHLYSFEKKHRLFMKVPVSEKEPEVDSVTRLWPAADWYEREAWDMFGVVFKGHPHLRRILMYEQFQGHPLRKDYPYNKRQPLVGPLN